MHTSNVSYTNLPFFKKKILRQEYLNIWNIVSEILHCNVGSDLNLLLKTGYVVKELLPRMYICCTIYGVCGN